MVLARLLEFVFVGIAGIATKLSLIKTELNTAFVTKVVEDHSLSV